MFNIYNWYNNKDVMRLEILKGYVFRMYPNVFQKELIEKSFGCSRFIYNYYLNDKQREYKENGKSKTAYDQIKASPDLCIDKPFLKEVDSCILRNSIFNLDNAYQKFYKEHKGYRNKKEIGNIKSAVIKKEEMKEVLKIHMLIISKFKEIKH